MTLCPRCGSEFDNLFQGTHWCVQCGKQFFPGDDKRLKEAEEKAKAEKYAAKKK